MRNKKLSLIIFALCCFSYMLAQKEQNISVLYVGYDPNIAIPEKILESTTVNGGMSEERFKETYKTRYLEFKKYLEKYFTRVNTVDARNYEQKMSDDFDVTIFDQVIEPWKEKVLEQNPDGTNHYEPAKYLTDDFDRAAIFIGHTAPVMGHSVGSKLDWLCLCLDANAHHIKTEHPIFKGPFPVKLTLIEKPTPEGIYHYPSGKDVPKQIPMWQVQTEDYMDGNGYRVGMVSRGDGFLDSPDAEYISSGVNTKDVGAVAIGRHGNYFLWGFSASPDYMTEEAKQVFANAIVYMKKFNGRKLIARKYNDRIATKDYVDNIIGRLNKESFEQLVQYYIDINEQMAKRVAELKAKKDKGEQLTEMEEAIIKAQSQPMPIPDREQYIKQIAGSFYKEEYKDDIKSLKQFLKENRKYMYSEPDAFYNLQIDEELKKIGVGNDTLEFFEKSISALKNPKLSKEAAIVLKRYTGMEKSQKEWEQWYKANKDKLFFTEAGGYKWMNDTTNRDD